MRVFLSYSYEDRDRAESVRDYLRKHGIDSFAWSKDALPGADWFEQIQTSLESCDAMIVIASRSSVKSPNQTAEVGFAALSRRYEGRVVCLLTTKSVTAQLPSWLARGRLIDFSDNNSLRWSALSEALSAIGLKAQAPLPISRSRKSAPFAKRDVRELGRVKAKPSALPAKRLLSKKSTRRKAS